MTILGARVSSIARVRDYGPITMRTAAAPRRPPNPTTADRRIARPAGQPRCQRTNALIAKTEDQRSQTEGKEGDTGPQEYIHIRLIRGTSVAASILRPEEPAPGTPFTLMLGIMHPRELSLSPAAQLLLWSASARPRPEGLRPILEAGIDWRELSLLAQREQAASVILRHLREWDTAALGREYADLRRLATISVMQMLQLEHLLHRTLHDLAERGIEAMLLKGAGLGYTAYPSFADRPMGDLDLLVHPAQARDTWEWLQTRGWTWPAARWAAEQYVDHHHLPPLTYEPGEFRLEIHSDLLPAGHPFRFPLDTLWTRAQRVRAGAHVVAVPHPLHQLWHLAVHFAWSHELRWGTWRTLRDTAVLAASGTIDWPAFVVLARESRAATCCFWMLRLARRLAGAEVPDEVLGALRPSRPRPVLEALERHYVTNLFPSRLACPSIQFGRWLWEAGILPRRSGHGRVRPWHVSEPWVEGPQSPFRTRLARLGASWAYVRSIQRFALPAEHPVTSPSGTQS